MNAADRQPRPTPTPDDWTDTVEPKRAEAFIERLPANLGYNLCHYGNVLHRIGEECLCLPSRIPHVGLAAPKPARPATLTPEQPVKAPVEGEDSPSPSEPVLPRQIKPEDVRVGMLVERRNSETYVGGRVKSASGMYILTDAGTVAWSFNYERVFPGWSLWLVEDAPAPVDPDAAAIEALVKAHRLSPECSTDAVFFESMLDHLRAQGFDVTARAEQ